MKQKSPSWLLKNIRWKLPLCFLFVLISLFCFSGEKHTKLFQLITSEYSGITIKNKTVESKSLNAIDTKNIYKSGSTGVGQEISWLPEGESSFPMTSAINNLISKLHGKMRTMVCQYKDSKLLQKNPFTAANLKMEDKEWNCSINPVPVASSKDAIELNVTFQLMKGKMESTGVAVAFDFTDWNTDNYVMIPASVYNGNRNKIEKRGYCTGFDKEDFYNKDIPQITTELPQLSPLTGGVSKIEVTSCNSATPAICLFDKKNKKGFIVLAEQGIRKDGQILDNGFIIEESADRSKATFVISAPGVRERKPEFIGFGKSPDRGINWKSGDKITLRLKLYAFETPDIPGLMDKFMSVRKAITGVNHPRELIPFSETIQLMTKQIDKRWFDNVYSPESSKKICIGWVGGLMNTYPMLVLNDKMHRERVISTFNFVIPAIASKSGYFLAAMNPDGKPSGRDWFPDSPIVLTRQNADALFWMIKQFMILKAQGNESSINPEWELSVKKLAQAFVNTWKKNGQWGNYVNHETGEIAIYNTTSGATAIGGLALAAKWFDNPEFLTIAKEAAKYYYKNDFVQKGFTYGACSDILQNADSETAAALMTSLMTLFESTGDKQWLEMSRNVANLAATWVVSYDYELPKNTELGRLDAKLAGAVWASTQNKHGAPGFCTSSGDPLFKIYRATGDHRYAELMRDVVRAWAEGVKPSGGIIERLTYCDADSRGSRGDEFGSNGWCELNGILMAMELPGIYLRTDKDEMVVFDHVTAKKIKRDSKGVTISVSNNTKYDAQVTILAENANQVKSALGYTSFLNWPKVMVKSGQTTTVVVNANGEILK